MKRQTNKPKKAGRAVSKRSRQEKPARKPIKVSPMGDVESEEHDPDQDHQSMSPNNP